MPIEMQNVERSDVVFIRKLRQSENAAIFHVTVRGKECVMKVYHDVGLSEAESLDTEYDIFTSESKAYHRLKARGLCNDGSIPQFFGTIKRIQPKLWKPHLDMFIEDKLLPNATLIEYIPRMHMMDLSTFSAARMDKLVDILRRIHGAKVLHGDPYPRNMMVVPGNSDRVLWIDFDWAQTFSACLTRRQEEWFAEEVDMMEYFAQALAKDHKEGQLKEAYEYYFDGRHPDDDCWKINTTTKD